MRNPSFTPAFLGMWRTTLPGAEVTRLDDVGHFSQEDAHERIVPDLLNYARNA